MEYPVGELFHIVESPPERLDAARDKVLEILRALFPADCYMEVGSTAVEGLVGKGDLDYAVRVPKEIFPDARQKLDRYFQRNPDQLSNEVFQGYIVDAPVDTAVQLLAKDSEYDIFEPFLQILRDDPQARDAYNRFKWQMNGMPMEYYRQEKAKFIEALLQQHFTRNQPARP